MFVFFTNHLHNIFASADQTSGDELFINNWIGHNNENPGDQSHCLKMYNQLYDIKLIDDEKNMKNLYCCRSTQEKEK